MTAISNGNLAQLVGQQLASASTAWSIGVPGALAEFHRSESDACISAAYGCITTARGGLRLEFSGRVRAVAYEMLSTHPELWRHGIVLCLRRDECAMNGRSVITEVGPDREAIRAQDRDAVLFDLGLGSHYCDFHVRTEDPRCIARLRRGIGTSLFDPCHGLFDEIPHLSPHRVFISRLGRLEVYQHIGKPGGVTPEGPHTHVMPKLFRSNRTHWADVPLPADWVPCITAYPANPVLDDHGMRKPFDPAQHKTFQSLLANFGDADTLEIKRAVWQSVRNGSGPQSVGKLRERRHRIACRIALRQMFHCDGESPLLSHWRSMFDPPARYPAGTRDRRAAFEPAVYGQYLPQVIDNHGIER